MAVKIVLRDLRNIEVIARAIMTNLFIVYNWTRTIWWRLRKNWKPLGRLHKTITAWRHLNTNGTIAAERNADDEKGE